ncbi:MAG TPA: cobalamin-binding protein [Pirellulaceae bacterium]|nr:cobalamin-binding protein [Pirellulaceae bacterium]
MRIVSLISSGTEILFALGLGGQVVAASHECDFPSAAAMLPRATRSWIDAHQASGQIDAQVHDRLAAGKSLYEIDAELICRLAPNLIVTQAQCDVCAVRYADVENLVQSRSELRGAQIVALQPRSLDDMLEDVQRIGRATRAEVAAGRLVTQLRQRIERVASCAARAAPDQRPRVVCIEWTNPLMAAGNWTPALIELAGGRPGLATAGQHSGYVSWDDVREFDPQVLLVAPCGFDLPRSRIEAEALRCLPGFIELSAVRSQRAFVLDGNAYLNRSGPRLVDSLEILAHLIQPERFPPPPLADAWEPLASGP